MKQTRAVTSGEQYISIGPRKNFFPISPPFLRVSPSKIFKYYLSSHYLTRKYSMVSIILYVIIYIHTIYVHFYMPSLFAEQTPYKSPYSTTTTTVNPNKRTITEIDSTTGRLSTQVTSSDQPSTLEAVQPRPITGE